MIIWIIKSEHRIAAFQHESAAKKCERIYFRGDEYAEINSPSDWENTIEYIQDESRNDLHELDINLISDKTPEKPILESLYACKSFTVLPLRKVLENFLIKNHEYMVGNEICIYLEEIGAYTAIKDEDNCLQVKPCEECQSGAPQNISLDTLINGYLEPWVFQKEKLNQTGSFQQALLQKEDLIQTVKVIRKIKKSQERYVIPNFQAGDYLFFPLVEHKATVNKGDPLFIFCRKKHLREMKLNWLNLLNSTKGGYNFSAFHKEVKQKNGWEEPANSIIKAIGGGLLWIHPSLRIISNDSFPQLELGIPLAVIHQKEDDLSDIKAQYEDQ